MPPAWQLVLEYSCLPAARPVAVPYRGPLCVQMVLKKSIVRVSGHLPCPLSIVHYLWYDVRRKGRENMLIHVTQIDEETVERLFAVYVESMEDLRENYPSLPEMKADYGAFLKDFVADPRHLVLVEDWVSGLRAIETEAGRWFLEAVETMPEERHKGYGKRLLRHTILELERRGMTEITCTISKHNTASQALHSQCGFVPTEEPPRNPWGELEEGTVLFRFSRS